MFIPASIPSPGINAFEFDVFNFHFTIHYYAICILIGIIAAVLITNHRLTKRGGEPWVVIDFALLVVPFGIIGARIYHVLTHPNDYFGEGLNTWNPFQPGSVWAFWEGGIAIFGSLIGGAVGVWLACKWTGIRFWSFADAVAPALLVAQALGRFGNWFNQELYGLPTDLPWGLEIDYPNAAWPVGLPEGTLFHPTFLYEILWNLAGVAVILLLDRGGRLRWGKALGVYLIWYGVGRSIWESIRIDPSEIFLGIRANVWGALAAIVIGTAILIVQSRRHTGLEPSVYTPEGLEKVAKREAALAAPAGTVDSIESADAESTAVEGRDADLDPAATSGEKS